jgi:hypothetical protein
MKMLFDLLDEKLEECVVMHENGIYDEYMGEHLPYMHRSGYVKLADYWKYDPDDQRSFLFGMDDAAKQEYIEAVSKAVDNPGMKEMTSGRYFEMCSLIYDALGFGENSGDDNAATPRERYMEYCFGRPNGLTELPENSPEEFEQWIDSNQDADVWVFSSDPWLKLCVERHDDGMYYLKLSGHENTYIIDVVSCVMPLLKAGYPLDMEFPRKQARKLQGDYTVGINPRGTSFPYGYVFDNKIPIDEIGYRKLPEHCPEDLIKLITWLPIGANDRIPEQYSEELRNHLTWLPI